MKQKERPMKVIRVTVEEDYYIEMIDDERTIINGWTLDEVIKSWFKDYPMDTHHASRDGSRIGHSRKFIKAEIKSETEEKLETQSIKLTDKDILQLATYTGVVPKNSEIINSYFTNKGFVVIYKHKE